MTAICIDDDPIVLHALKRSIELSSDIQDIITFEAATEALEWAGKHHFDIAFLSAELHGMDGIDLAKKLREINTQTGIAFCAAHSRYAVDVINAHIADGFLLKPIQADTVQKTIRYVKETRHYKQPLLYVHLTDGLAVYDRNGSHLNFKRSKTAQLLTILISHQGATLSANELCALLWPDDSDTEKNKNYLWQLFTDLHHTLQQANAQEVLIRAAGGHCVDISLIQFD